MKKTITGREEKMKTSYMVWILVAVLLVAGLGLMVAGCATDVEERGAPVYKGSFVAPDADDYVRLWDGADLEGFSDEGTTLTFDLDAATGNVDMEGTLDVAGATTLAGTMALSGDVTLAGESTGGNAGAKNEFIGLPRVQLSGLAAGTNGSTETTAYIDTSPTGEWAEVDGGTNVAITADTGIYRHTTNSVKIAYTAVVTSEGVDGTVAEDDLSSNESLGFWIYTTVALTSGDFDVTLDDTDGSDQSYDVPAVSALVWTWVELDVSGCDTNCNTTDGIHFLATGQGAAAHTAVNIYLDGMYKWDSTDEEALGVAIVQDGVLSVLSALTAGGTQTTLAEFTDYFTHYESGSDFVVWISDQSANDNVALVAY